MNIPNIKINKQQKHHIIQIIIIIIILFAISSLPFFNSYIQRFENTLIDLRLTLFENQKTKKTPPIIIFDIDTSSINKLSLWPWPRHYWAEALKNINKYNPKVIGVDVLFDTNSPIKQDDDTLANILSKSSNIILASRKYTEKKSNYEIEVWSTPISKFSKTTQHGYVNFPVDNDGVTRKAFNQLSTIKKSSHQPFPKLIADYFNPKLNKINKKALFLTASNEELYYINYTLNNTFKYIPFYLAYEDRIVNTDQLKDSIVLIGASDPALNDLFFSPIGQIPGVEIHAHTISTLIEQNYIYPVNKSLNISIIFLFICITAILTILTSGYISFLINIGSLLTYSIICLLAMNTYSVLLYWAIFIILAIISYASTLVLKVIFEEKQRKLVRTIFNQYVAPEVVKKLIDSPEALKLGGERKEVSIFFSDVRSFTTLSETYPAEQIISQLNEYLDTMTHCIFKRNGTLDKYVGDEIMAIWGAPISDKDHAIKAVKCGWEQLQLLKKLHKKWESENKPLFDIGIGINTGEVIVGNIGSTILKDYTVIGDSVNYAARLEGLTRQFSTDTHICRFIISETTYNKVKDICKVKALGTIPVKGKKKSFPIYEVIDVTLT